MVCHRSTPLTFQSSNHLIDLEANHCGVPQHIIGTGKFNKVPEVVRETMKHWLAFCLIYFDHGTPRLCPTQPLSLNYIFVLSLFTRPDLSRIKKPHEIRPRHRVCAKRSWVDILPTTQATTQATNQATTHATNNVHYPAAVYAMGALRLRQAILGAALWATSYWRGARGA